MLDLFHHLNLVEADCTGGEKHSEISENQIENVNKTLAIKGFKTVYHKIHNICKTNYFKLINCSSGYYYCFLKVDSSFITRKAIVLLHIQVMKFMLAFEKNY